MCSLDWRLRLQTGESSIYEFIVQSTDQCCEGSQGDVDTRAEEEDYDPRVECYDTAEQPICKGPDERVFGNPSAFSGMGDHTILWPWTWAILTPQCVAPAWPVQNLNV